MSPYQESRTDRVHAAELATDPHAMLADESASLLPRLDAATTPQASAAATAYRQALLWWSSCPTDERAAYLRLSAHYAGAEQLAAAVAADGLTARWSARWVAGQSPAAPTRLLVNAVGHRSPLATGHAGDRRVVVAVDRHDRKQVRRWDAVTGEPVGGPLAGHRHRVEALAIGRLRDGRDLLVTGGDDRTVLRWDAATGSPIGTPLGGVKQVRGLAIGRGADGRDLVAACGCGTRVRWWDAATGDLVGQARTGFPEQAAAVAFCALADGRTIVVASSDRGHLQRWDAATGRPVGGNLNGHTRRIRAIATTRLADGRDLLVTGGNDHLVLRFDAVTGEPIGEPLAGHSDAVNTVAIGRLPDGREVIVSTSGSGWGAVDGTIQVWDAGTGELVGSPVRGATSGISAAILLEYDDGRRVIAYCNDERTITLWDTSALADAACGDLSGEKAQPDNRVTLGLHQSDGRTTVLSARRGVRSVRRWSLETGAPVGTLLVTDAAPVRRTRFARLSDGRCLAITSCEDEAVRVWDVLTEEPVGVPIVAEGHTHRIGAFALGELPGGRLVLATGSNADTTVRRWDLTDGTELGIPIPTHVWGINVAAVVRPGGGAPLLVHGGHSQRLAVSDLVSGARSGPGLTGFNDALYSMAIGQLSDGRHLVVAGGGEGSAWCWDLATRNRVGAELTGHVNTVRAVAIGRDAEGNDLIATGSADQTVRLWTPGASCQSPLAPRGIDVARPVYDVVFAGPGQLLVATESGIVRLDLASAEGRSVGSV